jgi:hypothetical protein
VRYEREISMTVRRLLHLAWTVVVLGAVLVTGCSDSSGPGDTTIDLVVDPIESPTNNRSPTVSGITEPGATVTVAGPRDTLTDLASSSGAFSETVRIWPDDFNTITVLAVDSAGNEIADTLTVAHDGRVPLVDFNAPGQGATTGGQSEFTLALEFADQTHVEFASGPDPASYQIESDQPVGGVYTQNGTFSTRYEAGANLAPLFDVIDVDGATLLVPDSAAFAPGTTQLRAEIRDNAGNLSPPEYLTFEVSVDPDRLIAVDASGAVGSSGNSLAVGLANWDTVAGVQFDLIFDASVIASLDDIRSADRAASLGATDFNEVEPGRVRVVLFDVDGDVIEPGQGQILNISVSVQPDAPSGTHTVVLTSVLLSAPDGVTSAAPDATGNFVVP